MYLKSEIVPKQKIFFFKRTKKLSKIQHVSDFLTDHEYRNLPLNLIVIKNLKQKIMQEVIQKIENADWQSIATSMHQNGYSIIPNLLSNQQCEILKAEYNTPATYRKTVVKVATFEWRQFGKIDLNLLTREKSI